MSLTDGDDNQEFVPFDHEPHFEGFETIPRDNTPDAVVVDMGAKPKWGNPYGHIAELVPVAGARVALGRARWDLPQPVTLRTWLLPQAPVDFEDMELEVIFRWGIFGGTFEEVVPLRMHGISIRREADWCEAIVRVVTPSAAPSPTVRLATVFAPDHGSPNDFSSQRAARLQLAAGMGNVATIEIPPFATEVLLNVGSGALGVSLNIAQRDATQNDLWDSDVIANMERRFHVLTRAWDIELTNNSQLAIDAIVGFVCP